MAYDAPGHWRPEGHGGYDPHQPTTRDAGGHIPHQRDPAGEVPTDPGGVAGGRHAAGDPTAGYDSGAAYPAAPPPASFQTDQFQMGGYGAGGYDPGYGYDPGHQSGYAEPPYPEPARAQTYAGAPGFGEVFDDYPRGAFDDAPRGARDYPPLAADAADGRGDRRLRDRIGPHLLWELLLAAIVAGLAYLVWDAQSGALQGDELSGLLVTGAGFGLLGLAAGVTLRSGAPNLAIGPVAAAAGVYFADRGGEGVLVPTTFAFGWAILLGVATAVLVVGLHVPGWAAGLATAAATVTWLQLQPAEVPLSGEFDPTGRAAMLFAVVAAAGTLGALVAAGGRFRWVLGEFRPDGDPARRRGGRAAMLTGAALVLSMVLSVPAGVLLVAGSGGPAEGSVGVDWLTWTVIGFGVALLGGTSAFGRRGGVFGTTLAVVGLVLFHRLQEIQGWQIALLASAAGAVVAGLVVTRLVERFGSRRGEGEAEEMRTLATGAEPPPQQKTAGHGAVAGPASTSHGERADPRADTAPEPVAYAGSPPAYGGEPAAPVTTPQYWPQSGADSWTSALPARPAPLHPTPWEEERSSGR